MTGVQFIKKLMKNKKFKSHYFIFDTSSLLFDPNSLTYFKGNHVYIPVSVIQELDNHKDRLDHIGYNARLINKQLHSLKRLGSLNKGVQDPVGGVSVKLVPERLEDIPESLDKTLPDNRILSVCLTLLKDQKLKSKVHLVTNDLNLGLKAEAYGVHSIEFQPETSVTKDEFYKGYREIEEDNDCLVGTIYKAKSIPCPPRLDASENECFLIRNSMSKQSVRCIHQGGHLQLIEPDLGCYNIAPLNNEQAYAMKMLLDPEIKLIALTGIAGSGKTLISMATALAQTIDRDEARYEKIIISRSLILLSGKDKLGFLKGSLREKLEPYLLPMKDAIDQVLGEKAAAFDYLTAGLSNEGAGMSGQRNRRPKIEIEPLQYIRGRSLRNVIMIVDEAQNLTLAEVKAIVSRIGEGSKIVLLGDVDQVDNQYLTRQTNGLSQVIQKFKGSKLFGHIYLTGGCRSELATEAAERL